MPCPYFCQRDPSVFGLFRVVSASPQLWPHLPALRYIEPGRTPGRTSGEPPGELKPRNWHPNDAFYQYFFKRPQFTLSQGNFI